MIQLDKIWRALLYIPAIVVCLVLLALPAMSWWFAGHDNKVVESPFRWCVVANTQILKGLKINDENTAWAIKRLKADENVISEKSRVVGKYASANLAEGEIIKSSHFSEFSPTLVPIDGATIPVEVKTEHASNLKPGMRLAFVQEKEKSTMMIPDMKRLTGKKKATGFELVSLTLSTKDASTTTLTIAIEKNDFASVQKLARGQWRPVILKTP